MYGGSRRLFDTLHAMSLAGQHLYVEALLPTAALMHNLKAVALPEATASWESFHCCFDEAEVRPAGESAWSHIGDPMIKDVLDLAEMVPGGPLHCWYEEAEVIVFHILRYSWCCRACFWAQSGIF